MFKMYEVIHPPVFQKNGVRGAGFFYHPVALWLARNVYGR